MPSAQSHSLSTLKKRIQAHAERSKIRARRLLSAMLMAGAMSVAAGPVISTQAYAFDDNVDYLTANETINPLRDAAALTSTIEQDRQIVSEQLEYWVFSDDFCGWAAVQDILEPQTSQEANSTEPPFAPLISADQVQTNHQVNAGPALASVLNSLKLDSLIKPKGMRQQLSPINVNATQDSERLTEAFVSEIAAQEPIDVESSPMSMDCHATGRSSDQESIAESTPSDSGSEEYLPYDLSRADQIALRMYPMSIPHFHYLGGRRTESRNAFDYETAPVDPALDCIGGGTIWIEEVQPSQSIEITRRTSEMLDQSIAIDHAWSSIANAAQSVQQEVNRLHAQTIQQSAQLAETIAEAIRPESEVRSQLAAAKIGHQLGDLQASLNEITKSQTQLLAQHWSIDDSRDAEAAPELTAGEKLLLRAGIEANTPSIAAAGVADVAAGGVCCPVEQSDIASRLPETYSLAAVGVATATLRTPHAPSDEDRPELVNSSNPVAQAEVLATACDSAADTLERLARALRQAGDSITRVAKAGSEPGLTREPAAELR